jgi:molybdate transport system substrate-binding protein
MRVRAWAAGLLALALAIAGCGSDGEDGASSGGGYGSQATPTPRLTVSAATSLKTALTAYGQDFADADVRLSFAGSDELAAQIRQGVEPDVFASANTKLPDALFDEGLVEQPKVFTGNRLVLAVPASGAKHEITSLDDLADDGVRIAIGAESVPVGAYTRTVLDRLPAAQSTAILDNVRSNEPDVGGVVGKLSQGAVDAGFVYVTDVEASGGKLKPIDLPDELQPAVAYGVAIVKDAKEPEAARAFVDGLISGAGQEALRAAGFEPPPEAQ